MRALPSILVFSALALAGLGLSSRAPAQPKTSRAAPAAPAAGGDLAARGRYLVAAGDCMACHTAKGGAAFAGGRPIQTPFGWLLSANITPDRTGIGDWSADDFYRALHKGVEPGGRHLYPAFPYNYYARLSRADSDAMFAYLRSVPAVRNSPHRNRLPFPFNIRPLMIVWNWLFLKAEPYTPVAGKSAEWNRGAYLVQGLGHCGACHTPKNVFGAPKRDDFLHGGKFAQWFAPDLTANRRTGLGDWTPAELTTFLKTGRNGHASAAGEMGEVVAFSTSHLTDGDLKAIATYVADQPASPAAAPPQPARAALTQGKAIFEDECSACHRMDAAGVAGFFPPLKGAANVQQSDPTTTLRFILAGVRSTPTAAAPSPLTMPAYAWKLDDAQVAAVATYIRNAWGNRAAPVKPSAVGKLRDELQPKGGWVKPDEFASPPKRPSPSSLLPADVPAAS